MSAPPADSISSAIDHNVFAVYKLTFIRCYKQNQIYNLLRLSSLPATPYRLNTAARSDCDCKGVSPCLCVVAS